MAEYTSDLVQIRMWNTFDDWGLLLGLPRLADEGISTYKDRLLDVVLHRAGAQHLNLFYGINRDFGLSVYHDALILKTYKREDGLPVADDVSVEIRANGIHVSANALRVIREAEIIPSDTLRVRLALTAVGPEMLVESPIGTRLSNDQFSFDWDRNEIVFKDQDYAGLTITVSYLYYETAPIRNQTLQQVVDAINAMVTPGNERILVASIKSGVSGLISAEGIPLAPAEFVESVHTTPTGEYYDMLRFHCGEASLRALADEDFIKSEMGSGDTYFDNKLFHYVEQARNLSRFGWENLVFDSTRLSNELGLAVVPTLADPKTTSWAPRNPVDTDYYETIEADSRDYLSTGDLILKRTGFPVIQLQSGVGGTDDLKVVVTEGSAGLTFTPTAYDFFSTPTGDPTLTGSSLTAAQEGF